MQAVVTPFVTKGFQKEIYYAIMRKACFGLD